jgi:hypothetical protein
MTVTKRQRSVVLGIMLLATLAVTAASSQEAVDDGVVRPLVKTADIVGTSVPVASDNKAVKVTVGRLDFGRFNRDAEEIAAIDVFAPKSWAPPPPKVVPVVAQPVVPVAPPLPFRYVGQLEGGDGKVIIYLARGDTVHTVRVGDLLEEQYRLDALDNGQITLTYLPMNQQQMLAIPPR